MDGFVWISETIGWYDFLSGFPPVNAFFAYYFLKVHLHHSSQIKRHRGKKTEFQGFLTIFAL